MTTEELSALAYQNAPAPKGLEPCALLCYEALRGVYQLHRAGLLPVSVEALIQAGRGGNR